MVNKLFNGGCTYNIYFFKVSQIKKLPLRIPLLIIILYKRGNSKKIK